MSTTKTKDFVNEISCVSLELKEKLETIGNILLPDEKAALSISRVKNEDIWAFIENIFEKDKLLDDIISSLYAQRENKILKNMSSDISTEKNFYNYCVLFYNIRNTITFIDIIKENMESNKDGINNDMLSLSTGFAIGSIARVPKVFKNMNLKVYIDKIYNIFKEYMEEQ